MGRWYPFLLPLLFGWHYLAEKSCCLAFLPLPNLDQRRVDNRKKRHLLQHTLHAEKSHPPVVAIIGNDLAGVVAACSLAETLATTTREATICLLTGHSYLLEGIMTTTTDNNVPLLPDLTLDNRQLIERYGNGGRELAGLLAKQCTPLSAKEWLEHHNIIVQQGSSNTDDTSSIMTTLLQETPLFVRPNCHLPEIFQNHLNAYKVQIQTNVQIKAIHISSVNSAKFQIELDNGNNDLFADVVILAGDYQEISSTPILVTPSFEEVNSKAKATTTKQPLLDLDLFDTEDSLSFKDQMILKKKRQKQAKKQKLDDLVAAVEGVVDKEESSSLVKELSKHELRQLQKKRKKEIKRQKEQQKQTRKAPSPSSLEDDLLSKVEPKEEEEEVTNNGDSVVSPSLTSSSSPNIDTVALAKTLGHTVVEESFSSFTFMVPTRGILDGCSKAIVPKARLRCKVENPTNKGGRLPKWEGPLFMAQGEVSGPAALRLSSLITHDMAQSGYRGKLQIHFAPDIGGVEDLEKILLEVADPTDIVLKSSCPLVHREVDYDDYDIETGDFRSIAFPLIPDRLWNNLCQHAGITSSKLRWKDLPPASVQNLARAMVDCPLTITGIRPTNENVRAGGVSLKEVNMAECQSQLVEGLFLCGPALDIHGFDGGFNPLASFATGYVAGTNTVDFLKKLPVTKHDETES